jgi:N-hydroxyarylamine O-acetyltransferase
MLAVPFENLDIPLGRHITLNPDALWHKVIVNQRGGLCYELNTLFGGLLHALGYEVEFLSARVWGRTGWGPDKDHMVLCVPIRGTSWLADVGFGDSFLAPLQFQPDVAQDAGFPSFRLLHDGPHWTMQRGRSGDWSPGYRFTLDALQPESFTEMCEYQQTSPETSFTQRVVCSRATESGRVSVTHDRLIHTAGGHRDEKLLDDAIAFRRALAAHQGIALSAAECETIVGRFSVPSRTASP